MLNFWSQILDWYQSGEQIVLLYVIENKGSSPGRQGFKMAVASNGNLLGSIGGGIMEHKLVELAKSLLESKHEGFIHKHQIHNKSAKSNQSGMICSGEQRVVLIPITSKEILEIEKIVRVLSNGKTLELLITPSSFSVEEKQVNRPFEFEYISDEIWLYKAHLGFKHFVYIFGSGHVGLALSKWLRSLNFYVTVFEDRPDLNTFQANTFAHQKMVVDYDQIGMLIPETMRSYVIIMTFGYRGDATILQQLLGKSFAYLGMMGSQAKIDHLMDELKGKGYETLDLAQVHAPIGLPINSQTPDEIAVSIAAELIQKIRG